MANFNISLSVQELGAFFSLAQRFCAFLQTINIRMSERLCVLKHGPITGSLILQLFPKRNKEGSDKEERSCDWLERGSILEINIINQD